MFCLFVFLHLFEKQSSQGLSTIALEASRKREVSVYPTCLINIETLREGKSKVEKNLWVQKTSEEKLV
jgi:RNase P/RNase MRP subunit p30